MPGLTKKRDSRGVEGDGGEDALKSPQVIDIDFARLEFFGTALLRISRRECLLMRTFEILERFERYCEFNQIELNSSQDEDGVVF